MSTEQPFDQFGHPLPRVSPRGVTLARTVDSSITASTGIDLHEDTTYIRVYAISKDVYLRWDGTGTEYVSAANFDEVIIAGTYEDFMLPIKSDGTLYHKIQVLGRESGATVIVIEK